MVGVIAKGPGSRELVTFLAHDPANIGQRVLVTVVGRGRGQFHAQHCLSKELDDPEGEEAAAVQGPRQGVSFPGAPVQAPGLGPGGLTSGPTSATVTLSKAPPCLSLSFHIWEEGA